MSTSSNPRKAWYSCFTACFPFKSKSTKERSITSSDPGIPETTNGYTYLPPLEFRPDDTSLHPRPINADVTITKTTFLSPILTRNAADINSPFVQTTPFHVIPDIQVETDHVPCSPLVTDQPQSVPLGSGVRSPDLQEYLRDDDSLADFLPTRLSFSVNQTPSSCLGQAHSGGGDNDSSCNFYCENLPTLPLDLDDGEIINGDDLCTELEMAKETVGKCGGDCAGNVPSNQFDTPRKTCACCGEDCRRAFQPFRQLSRTIFRPR